MKIATFIRSGEEALKLGFLSITHVCVHSFLLILRIHSASINRLGDGYPATVRKTV